MKNIKLFFKFLLALLLFFVCMQNTYAELDPNGEMQRLRILNDSGEPVQNAAVFYRFLEAAKNTLPQEKRVVYANDVGYVTVPFEEKGVRLIIVSRDTYRKGLTLMSPERHLKVTEDMADPEASIHFWSDTVMLETKQPKVPMYVSSRPSERSVDISTEVVEFGYEFVPFNESKNINPKANSPLECDIVFEVSRTGDREKPEALRHPDGMHHYQVRVYGRNGWRIQPAAVSGVGFSELHEAPESGYVDELSYRSLNDLPNSFYMRRGSEFGERYGVVRAVRINECSKGASLCFMGYYKVQYEHTGNRSLDPDPKKENVPVQYSGDTL